MKHLRPYLTSVVIAIISFTVGIVVSTKFQSTEMIASEYGNRRDEAHLNLALALNEWFDGEFKSIYEEEGLQGIKDANPPEPLRNRQSAGLSALLPFAEQGDPIAALMVGRSLLLGDLLQQDICKAIRLIDASAREGNADAAFMLGSLYGEGEHLDRNETLEMLWILEARHRTTKFRKFTDLAVMGTMNEAEKDAWMTQWFEWSPKESEPTKLPEHCS